MHTLAVLAADPTGPSLNADGVVAWAMKNLLPFLLLIAGIGIVASARSGQISKNGNHVANILLGLVVIAAAGGLWGFANQITTLIFGPG